MVQKKAMTPINPLALIIATRVHSHHCLSKASELKALIPRILAMVGQAIAKRENFSNLLMDAYRGHPRGRGDPLLYQKG